MSNGAVERSGTTGPAQDLADGAGETAPLNDKENFERRPHRVQRKRSKGWRMPENTVYVGRPTKWGNPFKATDTSAAFAAVATGGKGNVPRDRAHGAVCLYFRYLSGGVIECPITAMMAKKEYADRGKPKPPTVAEIQSELRGKNLACFCPIEMPCHADVLLELANAEPCP